MINNNDINNNNNNQGRQDPSGGNVEHGVPEDPATLRHSASSTESTNRSSSSRSMSSTDRVRALARSQEDEAVPHPDEGLILSSDGVSAAHREGGISQTSQVMGSLTGIPQGQGQTLVSTYVVNPQSIAAGNAYHLTVRRVGRHATSHEPQWNWRDQCNEIASQTNVADYSMARRLMLIKQQEAAEDNETSCPLFTWT